MGSRQSTTATKSVATTSNNNNNNNNVTATVNDEEAFPSGVFLSNDLQGRLKTMHSLPIYPYFVGFENNS